MQINDNNFLIWDDTVGTDAPPVPHAYRVDDKGYGYMPVLYPGDTLSFYINFNSPSALAGGTLSLVRARDGQTTALGSVSAVAVTGGNHLYASFVVPASVANGEVYYLQCGTLRTVTYLLGMTKKEDIERTTTVVRFRHDRQFYNTWYHLVPSFYQQFRLHISVSEENPEGEREDYREVTTGAVRTFESYLDWVVKVETYYFDDRAHRAAAALFEHKELELAGRAYVRKSTYKRDNAPRTAYNKGEVELYEGAYSSINRC